MFDNGGCSAMMDESPAQNHSIQLGPPSGNVGVGAKSGQDEANQRPHYSVPGIVHFIQHEWSRFEMERAQWEIEKTELHARIAFLQGERKGQENLKHDLVRRIKMLEFALKQERAAHHRLKYGMDPGNQPDVKIALLDEKDEPMDGDIVSSEEGGDGTGGAATTATRNVSWRQGRQMLRQYLQEIGYTDTIIDVRSARVRNLLGLSSLPHEGSDGNGGEPRPVVVNGGGGENNTSGSNNNQLKRGASSDTQRRVPGKKGPGATNNCVDGSGGGTEALLDAEASVLATFDFLASEHVDDEEDDEDDDEELDEDVTATLDVDVVDELQQSAAADAKKAAIMKNAVSRLPKGRQDFSPMLRGDGSEDGGGGEMGRNELDGFRAAVLGPQAVLGPGGAAQDAEGALGLGELAGLSVANDTDYDSSSSSAAGAEYRKKWSAKYTLRSHMDSVRALAFHPVEPVLISASEDHTLKLWNLQKTAPAKKTASLDVEPVYTFRGHSAAVLSVCISPTGEHCFSAGLDRTIRVWAMPNSNMDTYDAYEPSVLVRTLEGHSDAIWGLAMYASEQLLSCSADGTVRLWSPLTASNLLLSQYPFAADEWQGGVPTTVDFVRSDSSKMVVGFSSSHSAIVDLETGRSILRLDTAPNPSLSWSDVRRHQMNRICSHPTLPLTVTAHEDRNIRFVDNNTGKQVHSMVAHLDAVTSLAIDPNGLYLLSGSHDSSIRLWHVDNKTCIQEITAHRKKFDESIHDVAFHPSKPYIASAGADALCKVLV